MLVYEFFVSISPVGPKKPSWTFMHVETTANSLSRSNYFNLFVIFFDALIVVIYDVNRSKYVMLVKKQKREMLEVSPSMKYKLKKLWICFAVTGFLSAAVFIMESSSKFFSKLNPALEHIVLAIILGICILCYYAILYFSSSSKAKSTLYRLMHERRVIFIVLLLGVLFYVENIFEYWSVQGVIFPMFILSIVSFDLIVMFFPRELALMIMVLILLVLCWNTFNFANSEYFQRYVSENRCTLGHIWGRYKYLHR